MSDYTQRDALATTFFSEQTSRTFQEVLLVLAGTALLAISAKVKVPFYPVPMTLQTLAVLLVAATYGMRLGVITVMAYLAEGMLGLPVFTNTPPMIANAAYFLGPTGGFLVGYPIAALIVGYAADRGWGRSVAKLFGAIVAAEAVIFGLGFVWLSWFAHLSSGAMGLGSAAAFAKGVAPFIPADMLKAVLAAQLVPAGWALADRWRHG
jgi:biotin transport system substrate-specific component